ncbi:hypothetical protein ACET3Z_003035 [Daucus carota]
MLKFYSHLDAHNDVLKLFDEMSQCGVRPDAFVYPILLKSAGKDGRLLHAHLLKLGHCCDGQTEAPYDHPAIDIIAIEEATLNVTAEIRRGTTGRSDQSLSLKLIRVC